MLVKTSVTFQVKSALDVRKLDRVNLLRYEFGLEVCIMHLRPLLTVLRTYEKPALLSIYKGRHCFVLDAKRPSRAHKQLA